jgi:hypothetical protein
MRRDRRLAVTARAPGLGLTVDYTSTVVPPTSATSSRSPDPVTRVTPPPPQVRGPKRDWPSFLCGLFGVTLFGSFFLVLATQGAGPIAWVLAVLLLTPAALMVVGFPFLLIGSALVGRPRNVAPPRASAAGASARDEKGR